MKALPPLPIGEGARLAALRDLLVLDTAAEPVFDDIARMASEICGTPIALMSLVDAERQWFKANVGLHGATQTPRDVAFCAHAILDDEVFEVPDASADARFADYPHVQGELGVRFYAGAPLRLPGGERVGTLCVIDQQARRLDATQRRMLRSLAQMATDALVMRRDLIVRALSARGRYEQALLDSESHYRTIVEDQSELISLARPDGTLTYVNPSYALHFGHAPGEMIGRSLFDFVQAEDRDAVRAHLAEVARSGQVAKGENRMIAADGSDLWVAWTNGVQRNADGDVVIHSVGRDVSTRVRAEKALRASQSFLYRTGRAAGVGGWEIDLATDAITWSDEARRLHEIGDDFQPTTANVLDFYPPEAREALREAIRLAADFGVPWAMELPMRTGAGREIWVRIVGAVENEAGAAVRLVGALQDISERKQLEQRIASQTATLSLVTDAIPATVALVDMQGRYRFVNKAFERESGFLREDIIGRQAREVLGDEEFQRRRPWMARAFAGEAVLFELDYPGPGGTRHVSIQYVPLRQAGGAPDGFAVVTQDVTRQRLESARLLEASQRDALTGLLNRAGFEHYLQRQLMEGGGPSLALLYIDLDRFKPVNDRHGHAVGDRVLKCFGERLSQLVRPSDAVVRLGGDEFAIVLPGTREPAHAQAVAAKVLAAAKAPFDCGGAVVEVGASIGMAFGVDAGGCAGLVERADAGLLRAKAAGRGRVEGPAG